jgi:DNA repair exonuclease SbcCD nuclease subunit
LRDLQGVIAALRELDDAGIPFLAVVGNHESKRDGQWLDLFEDLGLAIRLGADPHRIDDLAIYGLDFVPRSRREGLEYDFAPNDADHAVLVSHGLFEPFAHADWDTDRLLSESNVGFDALLLGDNHAPGREELQDTLVTYSGSTERASASERDDRGYNIVTVDDDLRVTRRGVPGTREFVFVDVELGEGEGEARVREQVRQYPVEDAVVIVTIEGEGDPVTPAAIEELASERGALVARVNDRRDIEEEADTEVSFADPDAAVDDRIADLGLSTAAHDVDEVVRASKTADSNVREAVERQVRDHVEEGDLDAFRGAGSGEVTPAGDPDDGADGTTDPEDDTSDGAVTTGESDASPEEQASLEEHL